MGIVWCIHINIWLSGSDLPKYVRVMVSCHSGLAYWTALFSKYLAAPSCSHKSPHHDTVTRLPSHCNIIWTLIFILYSRLYNILKSMTNFLEYIKVRILKITFVIDYNTIIVTQVPLFTTLSNIFIFNVYNYTIV